MQEANSPLKTSLLNLGLSDKETTVYLALLGIGTGKVSTIARKAGINRTTAYDILDDLIAKSLVSISGKEPLQEYTAESPQNITSYLKKKIREDQQLLKKAEKVIPELTSIHKLGDRPRVRFYEGKQGLEQVYEDTLTSSESIRAYAAVDDMHKALPDYFPKYYRRRTRKGIKIRAVIPATESGRERAAQDKTENRESALVPPDTFYFTPEINIYDNKVMIASWREQLGIIIESAEIADAMKKVFELSWQEAKRLHSDITKNSSPEKSTQ